MTDDTKTIPALDAVLTPDDTRNKGTGSYSVRYAPWGKISQLLRKHAPGWQPIAIPNDHGFITHEAPDGSRFLMMAFEFTDGRRTQPVPHAIMDNKMNAKQKVDARDVAEQDPGAVLVGQHDDLLELFADVGLSRRAQQDLAGPGSQRAPR